MESFLDRFFGPGNDYWPGRNPELPAERKLRPFLALLSIESDVPYILPRFDPVAQDRLIYIIPRNGTQSSTVREYVDAFVVPSYARYSDRSLRDGDPVDDAVFEFVGHRNILLVQVPLDGGERLWAALARLRDSVRQKPTGDGAAPVPLSRLLADFDLALAAGDNAASAAILDRLSGNGLSGSNYTHLVIKRLTRLGKHGELLRLPDLKSVAASRPPVPVKDAILAAIYNVVVEPALATGGRDVASRTLFDRGELVPPLATEPLEGLRTEALAVLAVAAAGIGDYELARRVAAVPDVEDRVVSLLPSGWRGQLAHDPRSEISETGESVLPGATPGGERRGPEALSGNGQPSDESRGGVDTSVTHPGSWRDLIAAVAADGDLRQVLVDEPWRHWPPPAENDDEIADALDGLDDESAERAWALAGPFVDSDDYGKPAARSAQAFMTCGLLIGRFGPADLAGLVALTEIVLRSSPSSKSYAQLLDDLNEDVGRWASIERASVVLDLADLLARNAAPDREARLRLTSGLLGPLSRQRSRLQIDEVRLARLIDSELSLGLHWDQPDVSEEEATLQVYGNLLLYSLDEAVLARVETALADIAPGVTVRSSHDCVGSPQLRERSRRADYIVMATRCAKHAATGFIRANANDRCAIVEADGAGSASLIRAAIKALQSGLPALQQQC